MVNEIIDYTKLTITATENDIKELIDTAIEKNCASVCIPPAYVKFGKEYANGRMKICTVIGFPNGYNTTETKIFETQDAIDNGADEIDMVINLGWVKDKKFANIYEEVEKLASLTHKNNKILKVIVETCQLDTDEVKKMCEIVATSGADFIKTSTGFSTNGAEVDVVKIMKEEMDKWNEDERLKQIYPMRDRIKIKASGGIRTLEAAETFKNIGSDRIGCSKIF